MPPTTLSTILELAELERPTWPGVSARIPGWHPRLEGDPDPTPDPDPAPDPDPTPDLDVNWKPPTREEYEAMLAERDKAKDAAARASREARNKDRQGKQDAGKFEELYNDEHKRAETLATKITASAIQSAVTDAAQRLKFRNPTLAARLIRTDDVDVDLDADTLDAVLSPASKAELERRLKAQLEADPYLASDPPQRQLAGAGGGGNGGSGNAAMNDMIRRASGRA